MIYISPVWKCSVTEIFNFYLYSFIPNLRYDLIHSLALPIVPQKFNLDSKMSQWTQWNTFPKSQKISPTPNLPLRTLAISLINSYVAFLVLRFVLKPNSSSTNNFFNHFSVQLSIVHNLVQEFGKFSQ